MMKAQEMLETIRKIDHLLDREEHDSGYAAFVHMRKIWPDLKRLAAQADAPARCSAVTVQEPVAWRWKYNGQWFFGPWQAPHSYPSEPLYAAPQPADSAPPEMQAAIRAWLNCPTDKRPSARALGQQIERIAAGIAGDPAQTPTPEQQLAEAGRAAIAIRNELDRVRAERDSWKAQFDSASAAASEYSEFWEKHSGDFDQFGNYIPYSQMDGDLRAAKAEIERLRVQPQALWRPIETAPKDGTFIIVSGRYSDDVAIVGWDERKKDWLCYADGTPVIQSQDDFGTDYLYFAVPSHWQPCPCSVTRPQCGGV
jgi:hypothetical protein